MWFKFLRNILLAIAVCILSGGIYAAGTISSMQIMRKGDSFSVVMYLRGESNCRAFNLQSPYRIVVDCKRMRLMSKPLAWLWKGTPVLKFRSSSSTAKLRMVWELKNKLSYKLSSASDFLGKHKLVLTLGLGNNIKSIQSKTKKIIKAPKVDNSSKLSASLNIIDGIKSKWPRDTIIVIDPGHGGKDPGATGVNNIHEKNVVLAISRDISDDINRKSGFKAYLTRNKDVFLSLRQRLRVARKRHADMFVAIHADAYNNSSAHGASVFALSLRGATSEAARWLAERENQSELIGGVDLADKDKLLRSVLIDLSQSATIRTSLAIGKGVIKDLTRVARIHHAKVEQAAFVVLKSPDIPSLLIETGFLSNRREARKLSNKSYQRKIAKAISLGIVSHFQQHPLPNTWLALRRRTKTLSYKVRRGDSISKIAARFAVATNDIKRVNRIRTSKIRIGQNLLIPVPNK